MDHGILAHSSAQHAADRGDEPLRKRVLLKGKTNRLPFFVDIEGSVEFCFKRNGVWTQLFSESRVAQQGGILGEGP
jgi:hypothetical protein